MFPIKKLYSTVERWLKSIRIWTNERKVNVGLSLGLFTSPFISSANLLFTSQDFDSCSKCLATASCSIYMWT